MKGKTRNNTPTRISLLSCGEKTKPALFVLKESGMWWANTGRPELCALTCSEKMQRTLRASITRASSTVAMLRQSARDSTRGMLPTCQS